MPAILTLLTALGSLGPSSTSAEPPTSPPVCAVAEGPEYYAIELVTTKRITGTGYATGVAEVSLSGASPFSVALTADGSYEYAVHVSLERMKVPARGRLIAWVTTSDLSRIERMGALDEHLRASGSVAWNQFLVVVTLEPSVDASQTVWAGPIVLRGMSRSGMMHTMVGHGPLQQENCAAWGYAN